MLKTKPKPPSQYHKSTPPIPDGLQRLDEWAKSKGLTTVCVRRWALGGKLNTYTVPGYGVRLWVKVADANKLIAPQQGGTRLAR